MYVATKNPSMPPADVAYKIARALGVSEEYLVTGGKKIITYFGRNALRCRNLWRPQRKRQKISNRALKKMKSLR